MDSGQLLVHGNSVVLNVVVAFKFEEESAIHHSHVMVVHRVLDATWSIVPATVTPAQKSICQQHGHHGCDIQIQPRAMGFMNRDTDLCVRLPLQNQG